MLELEGSSSAAPSLTWSLRQFSLLTVLGCSEPDRAAGAGSGGTHTETKDS